MTSRSALFAVALFTAAAAQAQTPAPASAPSAAGIQQLIGQNAAGSGQDKLQQGIVAAILLRCVDDKVGHDRAQAFYKEVQTIGQQTHALCKAGQYDQARQLVQRSIQQKQNDPVVPALLQCYNQHQSDIGSMASATITGEAEKYQRWLQNPQAAQTEMTNQDICKKAKP